MTREEQGRFNLLMIRLVGKTLRQCYYESRGFVPRKGPSLSLIRATIVMTEPYGAPKNAQEVVQMVRKVCYANGLRPLGNN
jgi:hypothetical protein